MLVEGPAELFLIPVLVKKERGVSLDELGISVIPIFGVHFDAYAKLFGPDAVTKKCAIVADGDLSPSDALLEDDDLPELPKPDLGALENEFVKVFLCRTTFERAITGRGTMEMFARTAEFFQANRVAARLREIHDDTDWSAPLSDEAKERLAEARQMVLNAAKRFGKARFAQVAARHVDTATWTPRYLNDAIDWLLAE